MFEPLRIRDYRGSQINKIVQSYGTTIERDPDMLEQFIQNWRRELERRIELKL